MAQPKKTRTKAPEAAPEQTTQDEAQDAPEQLQDAPSVPAALLPVAHPEAAATPPSAPPVAPQAPLHPTGRFSVPFGGTYAVDGSIFTLAAGSVVSSTTHNMAAILAARVQLVPIP